MSSHCSLIGSLFRGNKGRVSGKRLTKDKLVV